MSCFGDTSGDGGYSGVFNEAATDSVGTALTGVPGQTFAAKKICGGSKKRRKPAYQSDVRSFDPYAMDYTSPALQEMDYNPHQ